METVEVYYFSAPWCGPCKQLSPIIEELSKELTGIHFIKINTDDSPQMAAQYEVKSVPTIVVKKNGEIVGRIIGAQPKHYLKNWFKSFE